MQNFLSTFAGRSSPPGNGAAPGMDGSRQHSAELAGKTAIVTGSTSGIGLGIARAFAAAGMKVMLNGLGSAGEIEATRRGLEESYGTEARYSAADMSRPGDVVRVGPMPAKTSIVAVRRFVPNG